MRRIPIVGVVALILGVVLAVAVGLAITAANNNPGDPTWEYLGKTRDCDSITAVEFATRSAFDAWDEQCSSTG